jgi:hypothetical protein
MADIGGYAKGKENVPPAATLKILPQRCYIECEQVTTKTDAVAEKEGRPCEVAL